MLFIYLYIYIWLAVFSFLMVTHVFPLAYFIQAWETLNLLHTVIPQFYGRSRQCSRLVGAKCSMGLGRNPLINGLIQHTLKINFLFIEKFTAIPLD